MYFFERGLNRLQCNELQKVAEEKCKKLRTLGSILITSLTSRR
jgi:hypothetical protein